MRVIARRAFALLGSLALMAGMAAPAIAHDGINRRTNHYRAEHDRDRLRSTHNLNRLARRRARQISSTFSHEFWWVNRTSCKSGGENIAWRTPAVDGFKSRWFVRAWIRSLPHRRNMLGDWERMGSAIYVSPDGAMHGVQLFCNA